MSNSARFFALSLLALAACREPRPVAPAAPAWLDPKVDEAARAASPGGQRVGDFLRGVANDDGDRTSWTVPLDAAHCYNIQAMGDEGVEKIALYLFDPRDKRVESQRSKMASALLYYCPQIPGLHRLEVKLGGAGHYSAVVYALGPGPGQMQGPPPVPLPPGPMASPPPPVDLEDAIARQAQAAAPGATRLGGFFEGHADESAWFTPLVPGKCYWFIGAGEPGRVKKLWLYLWDPQQRRVADSKTPSDTAMIGHCPTQPGMFKFEVKVDSGHGNYKVGVFERKI